MMFIATMETGCMFLALVMTLETESLTLNYKQLVMTHLICSENAGYNKHYFKNEKITTHIRRSTQ